jgi:uncharacterized membrane protein
MTISPVIVVHVAAGTVALFSGAAALFAAKGGSLHRRSGAVFFVSMLTMAATASYLAVTIPGQQGNLFGGIFTFYLVATAWATVWRKEGSIGIFEIVAFLVPLAMSAGIVLVVARGAKGATAQLHGPLLIAAYSVSALVLIAAGGDLHMILRRGLTGASRIARHLWRMCVALTFATGSFFTNGFPRLLRGPMHVTGIYFAPMLVPLGLMVFWLIRVRFAGRYKHNGDLNPA